MPLFARRMFVSLMLVGSLVGAGQAAPGNLSAQALIEGLGDDVITVLADKSLDHARREPRFRELLQSSFDAETTGRVVLGRYWNLATARERQTFLPLYRDYLIRIYSSRFARFSGEKFVVRGTRTEAYGDTVVQSEIQPPAAGGPTYSVNWRVRKEGNTYRIVDVVIDGVSLLVTHNQEFSSIIQNGGGKVQALIDALQARAGRAN